MMNNGAERLLTPQEVADVLQVSVRTLEAWRVEGKGPSCIKIGKLARYREQDLKRYIEEAQATN